MDDRCRALTPVLGHPRVLREAAIEPRRGVLDRDGDRLDGVAAWEPLFARRGEGVVALRDAVNATVAARLVGALLALAAADGVVLVRFVVLPGQQALAATLAAGLPEAALTADELAVRLAGPELAPRP